MANSQIEEHLPPAVIAEVEHDGYRVVLARYPEFDGPKHGDCYRVEVLFPDQVAGETAYWYEDGTNDIMQGAKGTLVEASAALVDFAFDFAKVA